MNNSMKIQRNNKQQYLAVLVVITCTVLLQAHSIPFWLDRTGDTIGILWSVTIEFIAIWLWINKRMLLATVASFIVISVPLVHLSTPLLAEIRQVEANTQLSLLNNMALKQSEELKTKYLQKDWLVNLTKNATHHREAINNEKELILKRSNLKSPYENIAIIVLQSLVLIVVLLAQIQALRMLQFQDFEKAETDNFSDFENIETFEISENRAEILLSKIENHMNDFNITQLKMANMLGVPSYTISKLRNSVRGIGEGLSNNKLQDLEESFKRLDS